GHEGCEIKPRIDLDADGGLRTNHASLGIYRFFAEPAPDGTKPSMLFTDNETNFVRVFNFPEEPGMTFKDAFHEFLIDGNKEAISKRPTGTKAAAHYRLSIRAGKEITLRLRLFASDQAPETPFGPDFDRVFKERIADTDEFYDSALSPDLTPQAKS